MEEARRLRASAFCALVSETRLARSAAYSFYGGSVYGNRSRSSNTYGSILGLLGVAALECDTVTLVLKTLWGDKTLDLGGLGVWLLTLTLWLNLTTDNKLSDLK